MKQIVCDICGRPIKDKESPNGIVPGATYMKQRYGFLGLGKFISIDICDECVEKIRQEINKRGAEQ